MPVTDLKVIPFYRLRLLLRVACKFCTCKENPQCSNDMVKEKPDSVRTYDEDGFKRRAACLCFKDEREEEILLVTSHRNPDRWVVPGGGIEPEEEPRIAAMREAMEEAGVRGQISRHHGVFENKDRKNRTWVYIFHVEELLDHWDDLQRINRKRQWFSLADARAVLLLHKPALAAYIEPLLDQRAMS
ncbi:diphosphoinositol polyphosphate phosphohydrolase 1-like [Pomacea canaliculata]|uniref:diphosphoinositol polyphosphate phosphohydrolase 1-like n=1 Tax=Pomacea canaliculata TaxID=400727 RepID=UPI000D731109|nr:diphosphoinositol polyphosphate phosphohydrolase 1-like [Pomacea canaliculata]